MFELTNEQRKCFALPPVLDTWEKVEVKAGPYNPYQTYAYLDGRRIMKVVQVSDKSRRGFYREFSVDEMLSEDKTKILPKTSKGKPKTFTVPVLEKRTFVGMSLSYGPDEVYIVNNDSDQNYYSSVYENNVIEKFAGFEAWVVDWCNNTGDKELADINEFAGRTKVHQKYKEGDFFRFRINRFLYGYGRILVDFVKMRKEKISFWDVFMGPPLCVAVYHIATENKNMTPSDLVGKMTLPSHMVMDNIFYY